MPDLLFVIIIGCAVLLVLGGLIGHSLNDHLRDQQIRRQAAVRREIGEQWRALRTARTLASCPRCGAPCERRTYDD